MTQPSQGSLRLTLHPGEQVTLRDGSTYRVTVRDGKGELVRFCSYCDEDGPEFSGCCPMNEPPDDILRDLGH